MIDDTLINFGSEMKVLGETADAWQVGGWAVVFGSFDKSSLKDKFASDTDYDFENGEHRSLYYNHGLDGTIKKTRMGRVSLELKDAGVWYQGELRKRSDYLKAHAEKIADGIKDGQFGTSTGAPSHLVEREQIEGGHSVKLWPISEVSITPTPAEPKTTCVSLKSLAGDSVDISTETPEIKAKYLGEWVQNDMTLAALSRLNDALMYQVVSGALSPSVFPVDSMGFTATTAMPPAERMDRVRAAFDEFVQIALGLIERAMNSNADEAAKSLHDLRNLDVIKSLEILEQGQLEGSRFTDHSDRLLAATSEFNERMSDLFANRAHSRKSGRTFSGANIERIKSHHEALTAVCADMGELLREHGPQDDGPDTKSIDLELLEIELRHMEQHGALVLV